MRLKVYVAGPYTGKTKEERDANIDRARLAAAKVWESGNYAFCPHLNTARFDDTCKASYQDYIDGDLAFLETKDAVYVLTGWENSSGTMTEIGKANELNIPVYYQDKGQFPPYIGGKVKVLADVAPYKYKEFYYKKKMYFNHGAKKEFLAFAWQKDLIITKFYLVNSYMEKEFQFIMAEIESQSNPELAYQLPIKYIYCEVPE